MTSRIAADPKIRPHPGYDGTAGVSEVIGAILLVGLVVAAVAVVAVTLFSQTTPEKVPNVNFMVGTDNRVPPTLYLTHNGGDTLASGSFSVYVDGNLKSYSVAGGGNQWSLGKNLLVPLSTGEAPQRIYLVFNQTGTGSSVIGSASANVSVPSGKVAPDVIIRAAPTSAGCFNSSDPQSVLNAVLSNVSVIGDAMNQSPSTVGPVIANVVGANSITFYKSVNGNPSPFGLEKNSMKFLRFTVTKPGSSITATGFGSTPTVLYEGDIVTINLTSTTANFKTFGLGDQLWELTATGVYVNITHNGIPRGYSGDITHAWISGYRDVNSNLNIFSSTSGGTTSLVVNGTQLIKGESTQPVTITGAKPVGLGLFILQEVGKSNINEIYYVGSAQSVTW